MFDVIKTTTFKNLSTLLSGTVLAQLVPILVMPLLTRIFEPQAFGVLSVFVGIASIISIAACLRFEVGIPQAEDDSAAKNIFVLSLLLLTVLTVMLSIVVGFSQSYLYDMFNLERSASVGFFCLVIITFLCSGIIQTSISRSIRLSDFSGIALGKVIIAAVYALTQLLLGVFAVPAGLILGYVAGQIFGALYFFRKSISWLPSNLNQARFSEIKLNAKEYKNLPLYSAPSAMIDAFCSTLPVLVVAATYDLATAGMLGLAHRVLGIPASLISLSVSQVIFQKIASSDGLRPGFIRNIIIRSICGLAVIIIPFTLVIYLFGPDLFALIFGEEWRLAGGYAGILMIGVSVQFLASPNSMVLTLKENIKIGALWQCSRLVTLSLVLFFARDYDFMVFLWLLVLHEVGIYSIYIWLIFIGAERRVSYN
jgi:O-antigen/teichoic acid export membrane protein